MQLKKKQVYLLLVAIMATIVFVWQVISLMRSDISNKTSSATAQAPSQTTQAVSHPVRTAIAKKILHNNSKKSRPYALAQLSKADVSQQNKYVQLVHQYEYAKMENKILQQEVAIANSRHKIAKLNQSLAIEPSITGNLTPSNFGVNNAQSNSSNELKLVYLDYQNNHWSATLQSEGHFHDISPGSQLADGQRIVAINKQGVLISKGAHRFTVDFNGITSLPDNQTNKTPQQHAKTPVANQLPHKKTAVIERRIVSNHPQKAPKKKTSRSLDETVLLEMPASSYTILLRQSKDKNELIEFAKQHHIENRTLCYHNTKHPQPYFSLVYGDYLTTAAAKSALKLLPNSLRSKQLSIHPLQKIQKEITQ